MHDAKGRPLLIGDVVLIPFQITAGSPSEQDCNIVAVSIYGRRPDGEKQTVSLNSGITLLSAPKFPEAECIERAYGL